MSYYLFLITPCLLMMLFMLVYLYRLRKHDIILFKFCQIRRDVMQVFRKHGHEMSEHDFKALNDLLFVLNGTIHYYNHNKRTVFNYRFLNNFASRVELLKEETKKIEKAKSRKLPEITKLNRRFRAAMISAFVSYTLFLRSQLLLQCILFLIRILTRFGASRAKQFAEDLLWVKNNMNNKHLRHA